MGSTEEKKKKPKLPRKYVRLRGDLVRELRLERNLSIDELCEKTGLSSRTIDNVVAGNSVQLHTAKRIAAALDVPLNDLKDGTQNLDGQTDKAVCKIIIYFGTNANILEEIQIGGSEADEKEVSDAHKLLRRLVYILDLRLGGMSLTQDMVEVVAINEHEASITFNIYEHDAFRFFYLLERVAEYRQLFTIKIIDQIEFPSSIVKEFSSMGRRLRLNVDEEQGKDGESHT